MVVVRRVVDLINGVNHVDDVLHWHAFVGTKHHRGLAVVADFGIDKVGELTVFGRSLIHEVLELLVDVDGDGLFGHSLAVA